MAKDLFDLPLMGRDAVVRADSIDTEARTIEVVWTTGATVQRVRWEGWDDRIEYDEELEVSPSALRLDRLNNGGPFLDSHRSWGGVDNVLGSVVPGSVRIEGGNGYAKIRLTAAEDARPAVQRILERTINKVSVGYRVHRYEITKKDGQREHWRAVDWEPFEISAVAIPADAGASIRSEQSEPERRHPCVFVRHEENAAPAAEQKETTMSGKTKNAGGDDSTRNDDGTQQRANENGGQTTASNPTPAPTAPETRNEPVQSQGGNLDADQVRREERQRASAIRELVKRSGLDSDFADDLVNRGVPIDAARSAVLDKLIDEDPMKGRSYEPSPAQARSDDRREVQYRDALTNALQHRHNPGVVKLEEDAREFRGMSLLEIARHALERRGVSTRGMSKMELTGAAFQMRSAGMHGTSDFPAILANVANKTLRDSYTSTARTFMTWARRNTIVDFKPVSRTQLGGAPDLTKVLESGEFQYGTMGEGKEVYALATYGRILAVTRQALIDDDLDAFTRIPAAFGASAADLESDIVYDILLSNPVMSDGKQLFHADHNNLYTASVINEASLAVAYRKFGQQIGLEGRKISIMPRYILTPPGQRSVEARKQITSTTPANTGDVNTFAGRLVPIEEPRLIPETGQDPWFLAADPARIDTVEFAYLDGQEGVFTETRMGFEVDGMEIKARHDFAAKAIDYRGIAKNPGAAPA